MYFRKISPRTTCLYSAASMEPRRALAAAHSWASKPRLAEEAGYTADLFLLDMLTSRVLHPTDENKNGDKHVSIDASVSKEAWLLREDSNLQPAG